MKVTEKWTKNTCKQKLVLQKHFNMVIRGLRSNTDFEYELSMAQINARLYRDNVETVFLMTDPHYSFISSSMAKEVFTLGGSIKGLVPDEILKTMKKAAPGLSICPQCHEPKLPHRVCPNCNYYDGRDVMEDK